jgi:hypothetical protein
MVSRPPEKIRSTATAEPSKELTFNVGIQKKTYQGLKLNPERGGKDSGTVLVVPPTTQGAYRCQNPHLAV